MTELEWVVSVFASLTLIVGALIDRDDAKHGRF